MNILAAGQEGQEVTLIIANSLRLTASLLSWKEESSPADSREACKHALTFMAPLFKNIDI